MFDLLPIACSFSSEMVVRILGLILRTHQALACFRAMRKVNSKFLCAEGLATGWGAGGGMRGPGTTDYLLGEVRVGSMGQGPRMTEALRSLGGVAGVTVRGYGVEEYCMIYP